MNNKIKAVVIVGPTACGKTSLSIEIAKKFNGEIISADSMQIYKGIEIASAAPTYEEKQGIPHHLISILEPGKQYSVADFSKDAKNLVKEIHLRKKLPIIVGGTGLYIDSLLDNIDFGENASLDIRDKLTNECEEQGVEKLFNKLKEIDPVAANKLNLSDKKRIIRALEVYYATGETITERNKRSKLKEGFINPLVIGLNFHDREKLYDRINKRVDLMINNGLLEEAKLAFKNNYNGAGQAIGHKELFQYFKNNISLELATENLKMQTRRYAKRQLTWFRRNQDINWLYHETDDIVNDSFKLIDNFLRKE